MKSEGKTRSAIIDLQKALNSQNKKFDALLEIKNHPSEESTQAGDSSITINNTEKEEEEEVKVKEEEEELKNDEEEMKDEEEELREEERG